MASDKRQFPDQPVPAALGYYFPAEWHPHRATWLSWPHNEDSWPGKIQSIYPEFIRFIKVLTAGEKVCLNVNDEPMENMVRRSLEREQVDIQQIEFYQHPTNDAWCRDCGPAFLINPAAPEPKVIVDWRFNAWGGKYTPYELDDQLPERIAEALHLPVYRPGIVMEGGAVDFNGAGTVLTTTSCLLHANRNPHLSREEIEQYLEAYYGVKQVLWLEEGIAGDDTDGHVDDIARFVNVHTVAAAVETNPEDENYRPLQRNLKLLKAMRLPDGKPIDIVELPMPRPVYYEGRRLPASYANFYIANQAVIVPTFRDREHDEQALQILSACFPDREIVGIDSVDIIWGLGSFHCLSQQEPAVV
ncbi:MAG: agmatine deiminase family protein [Thermoflavifilum sp.]|uniref:agmatine deiminase family protein n=1 Tax=Thermoflavifilum sp. TaxID=1968839 RepID=UPI0018A39285|nr:agmatine deiminase family protein [Thermoflavifilum sp.]QOR76271.1 MAG: agmatine deiminase family protein [Thermoflavifilum sp.]